MARLADPFAVASEVLRRANVTSASLDSARSKWEVALKDNQPLAEHYGEIYRTERSRLRGHPEAPMMMPVETVTPALPAEEAAQSSAMPAETALLQQLTLGQVLPFVEGEFKPETTPVALREAPSVDGGTKLTPMIDGDTLPFVRLLPSQTLKKRR
jgi:hypothetical protein